MLLFLPAALRAAQSAGN